MREDKDRAFAERRVAKRYHAIVGGAVVGEHGRIELALDGKSAVTLWRVLRRARSLRVGGGHLTSLELCPLTGRTHQLRRHCAEALGCPILGDKEHGGEDVGSGLYLAALGLSFVHPDDGGPVTVEAPEPRKFGELLRREHERWGRLSEEACGHSWESDEAIGEALRDYATGRTNDETAG